MSITLEFINVTMLYHTLFHYRKKNEGALQESMILGNHYKKLGALFQSYIIQKAKARTKTIKVTNTTDARMITAPQRLVCSS